MIDSREIRAGNWVMKMMKTNVNTQSMFEFRAIAFDEYYHTFSKVYFPIEVTATILAECGFELKSGVWHLHAPGDRAGESSGFLAFNVGENCWYLDRRKLQLQPVNVHQLQNLYYALTGQELELKLDKYQSNDLEHSNDLLINNHAHEYSTSN